MAVTITTFTIASDFLSLNLVIDAGTGNHFHKLYMYVGDDYLSDTYVDLSDMLTGAQTETLEITNEDLGLAATEELIGIFTVYAVANDDVTSNYKGVANLYYANLCLANMIVNKNSYTTFDELNTIYLLLKAIGIYLPLNKVEQALNAYDKVVAMCERNPSYLVDSDIDACETGSGCWIQNGVYVINPYNL
jgi:hypothetical protein